MLRYKASNHPEIEMKFHNKIRNAKSPWFLNMGPEIKLNTLRNKERMGKRADERSWYFCNMSKILKHFCHGKIALVTV